MARKVECPYCHAECDYADNAEVYRRSYGMMYICRPCEAFVGVHKGTDNPLGRPAKKNLRLQRRISHGLIDVFWRTGLFKRGEVYKALQVAMELEWKENHVAMWGMRTCVRFNTEGHVELGKILTNKFNEGRER